MTDLGTLLRMKLENYPGELTAMERGPQIHESFERALEVHTIPRKPVQLTPIPWGQPDEMTAQAVIQNMVDTTPATEIKWCLRAAKIREIIHGALQ